MGAQGTSSLDFGVFPGSNVAYTDVAAAGVISTSAVEAWIRPVASADHTDTDHVAAPMKVVGQYLSDNNIRIYGINQNDVVTPMEVVRRKPSPPLALAAKQMLDSERKPAPMFVGLFNVWWVWN